MKVEILGNVQDGGVPHLSCTCEVCEKAREDSSETKFVSSLVLKEGEDNSSFRYVIGASPDIRHQIKGDYLDGIFVSDTHLGDITGLVFLGKHAMNADGATVYCNSEVEDFIMKNDPYRLMVDHGHMETKEFENGNEEDIQGVSIEAREVISKGDYGDTSSYMIKGEDKKLYYVKDLDRWTREAKEAVEEADIAIIDGTFWSEEELERYQEVPHPTIQETMETFSETETEIYFANMKHNSPVLIEDSEEREELEEVGFSLAEHGQEFEV